MLSCNLMNQDDEVQDFERATHEAAADPVAQEARLSLASFTAKTFLETGDQLHFFGHVIGRARITGQSPFGHGSDATVGISLLLRIAAQLVSAITSLFSDGRHYAAAALLRQLVEVEYLTWAFESGDRDADAWLRSTKEERMSFFTPAKLRQAAAGRFRGKDYGYHCELGGHPVPGSSLLLRDHKTIVELLLSDLLGHTGRIWNHTMGWVRMTPYGDTFRELNDQMAAQYSDWRAADRLVDLPPPSLKRLRWSSGSSS